MDLTKSITEIQIQLSNLPGKSAVIYVVLLLSIGVMWGLVSGFLPLTEWYRQSAYARAVSPFAPDRDVFNMALGQIFRSKKNLRLSGKECQAVPWIQCELANHRIFGRMQYSSKHIDRNKPFEIFLSPVYELKDGTAIRLESAFGEGSRMKGVYMKIRPEQELYVISARADWLPNTRVGADGRESVQTIS